MQLSSKNLLFYCSECDSDEIVQEKGNTLTGYCNSCKKVVKVIVDSEDISSAQPRKRSNILKSSF